MPLNQNAVRSPFGKLNKQLSKLAKKTLPENIHKFRTSSRRVEVLVEELAENRTRNDKKLVKLLARLRKKAGRVRDLDVEIAVLRSLKVPEEPVRKSQLMRALAEERAAREKKLVQALDQKAFADLRRRLKRTAGSLRFSKNANPLAIAMQKIAELDFDPGSMTNATLHCFRIAGKRARYVAEMAGKGAEAAAFVEQLNRMQDALGDWHDWAQLAERARKRFGGVEDSSLVAVLRNVTRAKYRHAVNILTETRTLVTTKKPVAVATMSRRPAREGSAGDAAVA